MSDRGTTLQVNYAELMGTVSLRKSTAQVDGLLVEHIEVGRVLLRTIDKDSPNSAYREYQSWVERGEAMLEASFQTTGGFMAVGPVDEFRGTNAATMLPFKLGTEEVTSDNKQVVFGDLRDKIRVLESLRQRLDLYDEDAKLATPPPNEVRDIFVVHGHDLFTRERVRLFLSKVTDRKVLVLEEQPNRGSDVLGKLLENASRAAFAVIILSGDDEGRKAGASEFQARARQNVILELGLFVGLLGRDKVAALYQPGVEIPSDYSGVLWTELAGEDWTIKLAMELKAAGIQVDMNALI